MISTMMRLRPFSRRAMSTIGRATNFEIPFREEQLMIKMKDRHFNQYGLRVLSEEINLFKQLTLLNASYIINSDVLWKHRATLSQLRETREFIYKTNKYKLLSKDVILERLFSTLYLSLHYYKNNSYKNYKETVSLLEFIIHDYHYSFYGRRIPKEIDLDGQANLLINSYYFDLEDSNCLVLSQGQALVRQVLYLLLQFIKDQGLAYSIEDLTSWLISVNAPTIFQSAKSLTGLSNIPLFIVKDMILRQPRSVEDLLILLELSTQDPKKLFGIKEQPVVPLNLQNVINGCMAFDSKNLKPFLKNIFENSLSRLDSENLVIFANKIIRFISDTNVSSARDPFHFQNLLNSQTFIVSYLSKLMPHKKTSDLITIEGYIGIATIFSKMGDETSFGVFNIAESQYDKILLSMINDEGFTKFTNMTHFERKYYSILNFDDLQAEFFNLKLLLATSEVALSKEFEVILQQNSKTKILIKYPKLWASYVITLHKFNRLTSTFATEIWELYSELVLSNFNDLKQVKIDSNFIRQLIYSIDNIPFIIEMFKTLTGKKYTLNNVIMVRFFSKLYTYIEYLRKGWLIENTKKLFDNTLSYTRTLYKNHKNKTTTIVSTMLLGESRINPESLYDMYYNELNNKRRDENSLRALCNALLYHYSINEEQLMWLYEGRYLKPCYEVCVLEMNRYIMKNQRDVNGVYPHDKLWKVYLKVLSTFNLRDELMRVFSMWEDLKYKPSEDMILKVLVNLDSFDATRILKHGRLYLSHRPPDEIKSELQLQQFEESMVGNDAWPWPDEQSFANYRYWHEFNAQAEEKKRSEIIEQRKLELLEEEF